jgi:hypothetical protein
MFCLQGIGKLGHVYGTLDQGGYVLKDEFGENSRYLVMQVRNCSSHDESEKLTRNS